MTKSIIDTPVEENPVERIAHGLNKGLGLKIFNIYLLFISINRQIIDPMIGGNKITKYLASQVTCCFLGMFCPDSFRKTVLRCDNHILILEITNKFFSRDILGFKPPASHKITCLISTFSETITYNNLE